MRISDWSSDVCSSDLAIVDEDLWERIQMQLREKAPPRKRPKNDRQNALLVGLLVDRHQRQIVPTYTTKGTRRYAYYETRKDLARPADPPSIRFTQGLLDGHVLHHLGRLLADDHGLRRLANFEQADLLRAMRSEEHTSELQSLMRISYAVFRLKK